MCCSAQSLTVIANAKVTLHQNLKTEVLNLITKIIGPYGNSTYVYNAWCATGKLNISQCNAVLNDVLNMQSAIQMLLPTPSVCLDSLTKYSLGMYCLSCDPNYAKYLSSLTNNKRVMNIHTNTANIIVANCAPTNQGYINLRNAYGAMMVASSIYMSMCGITSFSNISLHNILM